jgi:hypothetical protein
MSRTGSDYQLAGLTGAASRIRKEVDELLPATATVAGVPRLQPATPRYNCAEF